MPAARLLWLAAVLGSLAIPLRATATQPQRYLVSIGHNDGQPGETSLRFAERDARELAELLQRLGQVPAENTAVAVGDDAARVRRIILEVNSRIRAAQRPGAPDSVLLVYYSGHADAAGLHLGRSLLAYDELRSLVSSSSATLRVLVIDSCRSGGLTRVKGVRPTPEFQIDLDQRLGAEGLAIITSSTAGEDSQESDALRGSFFSHHLLSALRGAADQNRDGRVTLDEAYLYAYHQTLRSSGSTARLQHPTYEYDIKGRGELTLTWLAAGTAQGPRLRIPAAGLYLVMEGRQDGPVVAEVAVGNQGGELLLRPGRYFVQERTPAFYREYQVTLGGDGAVDLGQQRYRTLAYARLVRKGGGSRRASHGIQLLGGMRGPILDGHGIAPELWVGYALDLRHLSLGARFRWSRTSASSTDGLVDTTQDELGLSLVAQRYFDLPFISLAVGLLAEATWYRQVFSSGGGGNAPQRSTFGGAFGGFAAVERELTERLVLRVEGGPVTQIFRKTNTNGGAPGATQLETPLTGWFAAGLVGRF